jgi:hypothetical protein
MSNATDKPKKHISEITAEYKPFWQPLFKDLGIDNPTFGAKLCYMGKEFSNDGTREACVRFFPSELNSGNDYFTELFDWDQYYFTPNHRTLYKLPHNPHWKSEPEKYVEIPSDKLPTSTYAVRLSDLEIVNKSDVTAIIPTVRKETTTGMFRSSTESMQRIFQDPFDEESFDEAFAEKEDNHYTSMTVRDLYCMIQNVPMSNKKWLNQLISKNNK